ncbi:MAG TPA: Mur ligase family protein [Pseudobacteroides sp.]|uniref:Mur ligase family protein n=1 Tax=Pseudobacteroides sp. TaxID=1968840 RepID=UPI002F95D7F9
MNLRLSITIAVSKIIIKGLRLMRRGGTTLPGKIALKLYPGFIKEITHNFKIIMVTGTNGKTTTSRIISQILNENDIEFISNKSGANLVSGIATTFLDSIDIKGNSSCSHALLEIDEAAFKSLSNFVEPDILVVTNFFRDQLDRYGELYTTLNGVKAGIAKHSKTKLVLNADDSLCASIGKETDKEVVYYGVNNNACDSLEENINNDASFCLYCQTRYEYQSHIYGHLGEFSCPACGYRRPQSTVNCVKVLELNPEYSNIHFSINSTGEDKSKMWDARVNLPGLYNVYNALAAAACGSLLNLPVENTIKAMGKFECGFGRMETINAGSKKIRLILVKNPTGFNQVLNYLLTEDKQMQLAFLLNDNLADGTDISWIWDVDFEKLEKIQHNVGTVYASGIRAEDMAVRLKYAGVYTNKICIIKDYKELISTALENTPEGQNLYILPTYTAMTELRKFLKNKFGLKEFWK